MALEYVVKSKGLTPGEDVIFDDSIKFEAMTGAFSAGTGELCHHVRTHCLDD